MRASAWVSARPTSAHRAPSRNPASRPLRRRQGRQLRGLPREARENRALRLGADAPPCVENPCCLRELLATARRSSRGTLPRIEPAAARAVASCARATAQASRPPETASGRRAAARVPCCAAAAARLIPPALSARGDSGYGGARGECRYRFARGLWRNAWQRCVLQTRRACELQSIHAAPCRWRACGSPRARRFRLRAPGGSAPLGAAARRSQAHRQRAGCDAGAGGRAGVVGARRGAAKRARRQQHPGAAGRAQHRGRQARGRPLLRRLVRRLQGASPKGASALATAWPLALCGSALGSRARTSRADRRESLLSWCRSWSLARTCSSSR